MGRGELKWIYIHMKIKWKFFLQNKLEYHLEYLVPNFKSEIGLADSLNFATRALREHGKLG